MKDNLKSYSIFRKEQFNSFIRQTEIPIENYISLPIPNIKNNKHLYSYFSCTSQRTADEKQSKVIVVYGGVNKKWNLSAENGSIFDFESMDSISVENVAVEVSSMTLSELKKTVSEFDEKMNIVSKNYFNDIETHKIEKKIVLDLMEKIIPAELRQIYKELNLNFFNWLMN
jgi:small nuclear ribonucleoprotein (snRNP)-like protein